MISRDGTILKQVLSAVLIPRAAGSRRVMTLGVIWMTEKYRNNSGFRAAQIRTQYRCATNDLQSEVLPDLQWEVLHQVHIFRSL